MFTVCGAASAPEALAHHFWQAGRHENAAQYYERAGDSAMTVFAYDDSAVFYQHAAEGLADAAARARILAKAARALIFGAPLNPQVMNPRAGIPEILPKSGPATNDPATPEQLKKIEQRLRDELDAGALGWAATPARAI